MSKGEHKIRPKIPYLPGMFHFLPDKFHFDSVLFHTAGLGQCLPCGLVFLIEEGGEDGSISASVGRNNHRALRRMKACMM
ncbi:hypothetical protein [Nitrosomonas sp. Nm33]|uniref:hypothetical protein n=1 Tax=Nitrosomonas sp. Nm33 TaxID=133724 RepID=UPI00089C207F|nr:hypothetical protein [Nitrosomonas sp. Nm33]SDY09653.1 hypothetical protein SAMN05421755_100731 [Nitrosomonas sp. Nm33]